jgi:hypothetical protein
MHSQNVRPRARRWLGFVFVVGSVALECGAGAALGCAGDPPPRAPTAHETRVVDSGFEAALAGWCAEAGRIPGCLDGGAP